MSVGAMKDVSTAFLGQKKQSEKIANRRIHPQKIILYLEEAFRILGHI